MIVKINGVVEGVDGRVAEKVIDNADCKVAFVESGFKFDCADVWVPDLEKVLNPGAFPTKLHYIMAKWDRLNYSLMSKHEFTDFLYRLSTDTVEKPFDVVKNMFGVVVGLGS